MKKQFLFIALCVSAAALLLAGCDLLFKENGNDGNGVRWTAAAVTDFGTTLINAIAYGGDKFVAAGCDGKAAYSSDGENWTAVADDVLLDTFSTSDYLNAIAYGGDKFVAVGKSGKAAYWVTP
ncbi:MAG: hypothetical protein MdMp014T_1591 [Treponematales bacterium]